MSSTPVYHLPKVPLSFPRQEWYDSEWWRTDTKWHRMAHIAKVTSVMWAGQVTYGEKDGELTPWGFKLAVFDRVNQINHQLRRFRQYTGVHATVQAWQDETDKLIELAYDEAVLALFPKGPLTKPPPLKEVRDFVRIVLDHDYVQGKDAEPEFTATSDWDESEYINDFDFDMASESESLLWPFSIEKAEKFNDDNPLQFTTWQHPARSVQPDEWKPWKYEAYDSINRFGPVWERELDFMG